MSFDQPQRRLSFRIVGLLLAAVPFAFGVIRFAETRSDMRYLWTAIASTLGAVVIASPRSWTQRSLALQVLAAFIAASLCGVLCALLLGVTFGPALLVVCCAFGLFSAIGIVLIWRRSPR
ncbi:MAG TPA: hypothetical protein VES88_10260 [Gemmatimonadaceae bacterium]|nr:hypothetical protein [Gemmatimonadaceae bacterium]